MIVVDDAAFYFPSLHDETKMNPDHDPSAALASLLAILSQSTQKTPLISHPRLSHPHPSAHVEPIFPEGDILDTTPWIGIPTTPWSEPRTWQLPRHEPTIRPQIRPPLVPSSTSVEQAICSTATVNSFTTYSQALKHIVRQTQSEDFIHTIRKMKTRQDNFESDLFEQRSRIVRKYESKGKMNELLKSIGSQYTNEQVQFYKL